MASYTRLRIGVLAFVWQLLSELELCRVSPMGACDEHPHFDDPGARSTLRKWTQCNLMKGSPADVCAHHRDSGYLASHWRGYAGGGQFPSCWEVQKFRSVQGGCGLDLSLTRGIYWYCIYTGERRWRGLRTAELTA